MKLLYSFLRYLRNLNLFKLQKHYFFFISETDVKMTKETQRTRQSNKTFKMVAKAEVDLNQL